MGWGDFGSSWRSSCSVSGSSFSTTSVCSSSASSSSRCKRTLCMLLAVSATSHAFQTVPTGVRRERRLLSSRPSPSSSIASKRPRPCRLAAEKEESSSSMQPQQPEEGGGGETLSAEAVGGGKDEEPVPKPDVKSFYIDDPLQIEEFLCGPDSPQLREEDLLEDSEATAEKMRLDIFDKRHPPSLGFDVFEKGGKVERLPVFPFTLVSAPRAAHELRLFEPRYVRLFDEVMPKPLGKAVQTEGGGYSVEDASEPFFGGKRFAFVSPVTLPSNPSGGAGGEGLEGSVEPLTLYTTIGHIMKIEECEEARNPMGHRDVFVTVREERRCKLLKILRDSEWSSRDYMVALLKHVDDDLEVDLMKLIRAERLVYKMAYSVEKAKAQLHPMGIFSHRSAFLQKIPDRLRAFMAGIDRNLIAEEISKNCRALSHIMVSQMEAPGLVNGSVGLLLLMDQTEDPMFRCKVWTKVLSDRLDTFNREVEKRKQEALKKAYESTTASDAQKLEQALRASGRLDDLPPEVRSFLEGKRGPGEGEESQTSKVRRQMQLVIEKARQDGDYETVRELSNRIMSVTSLDDLPSELRQKVEQGGEGKGDGAGGSSAVSSEGGTAGGGEGAEGGSEDSSLSSSSASSSGGGSTSQEEDKRGGTGAEGNSGGEGEGT
uniref:Lon N-terminal domain-containing protein n=1 Tax=Chromera velia CCMP2878 TaxID=1169474 RepID=A0A0G4HKI9_9ALVE|eukprot:Cvel_7310.t1-p1 / transcript=Cvel_7310.t1 / gene=Cvel_7310 / organism=Chromera_velia_CCMP2878 / gene_product=hypothetical protein / transcript_product=hypothetical protein / location=Cvel_scaffold378:80438-91268(-) / protein_length=656 / sequence_SO=supercontig / SO=protein_coding / is_pseudo=false